MILELEKGNIGIQHGITEPDHDLFYSNKFDEYVMAKTFWHNAFSYLGGLIKDHTNEELKLLISDDCEYITKEDVIKILKI